jgi:hypothetical protein
MIDVPPAEMSRMMIGEKDGTRETSGFNLLLGTYYITSPIGYLPRVGPMTR